MSGSCLYECSVMHRRFQPKEHQFVYKIFLFLLDLDRLDEAERNAPVFSVDKPNLYSLRTEDYFQIHSGKIRENLESFLRSEGYPGSLAGVRLLTLPRLLGYTFNPISVFFCEGGTGAPEVAVVQVGNTFGELKPYLVPREGDGFRVRAPKHFYVSPFSDLDLEFDFRIGVPGDHLGIWIDEYGGEEKILASSLVGTRRELALGSLLWLTAKYPLVTLKIIAMIHWEALRLWLKGVPHRLKESDPHLQRGVFRSRD